ncbi:MAG: acyl-CoA thioesterase [Anaerolineae bacterium]|nr:acyl-CoA thioesterase [Anaerolineae bacterium]
MKPDTSTPEVVETTFYVRFAETDAMGVVHHAAYIVWMEEGRSVWGRAQGTPYNDFIATGFYLALVEVKARYTVPARYGQRVTVRTWLEKFGSRGMTFAYEIINPDDGAVHLTGTTRHICVTREGRPARFPEAWLARLEAAK